MKTINLQLKEYDMWDGVIACVHTEIYVADWLGNEERTIRNFLAGGDSPPSTLPHVFALENGTMNKERWNKLMGRARKSLRSLPRSNRRAVKRAWLKWADQETGKNCFWGYME